MDFLGTVVSAVKVARQVKKYFDQIQGVDNRVQDIILEVDSLDGVLDSISKCSNDSSIFGLRTGFEEHRQHMAQVIETCKNALERLRVIGETIWVNTSNNPFLRRTKMKVELDNKSDDINLWRERLAHSRQTLQLSLQVMTVYVSHAATSH